MKRRRENPTVAVSPTKTRRNEGIKKAEESAKVISSIVLLACLCSILFVSCLNRKMEGLLENKFVSARRLFRRSMSYIVPASTPLARPTVEERPSLFRRSSDTSSMRSRSSSASSTSRGSSLEQETELQPWIYRFPETTTNAPDAVSRKKRELRERRAKETWTEFWG